MQLLHTEASVQRVSCKGHGLVQSKVEGDFSCLVRFAIRKTSTHATPKSLSFVSQNGFPILIKVCMIYICFIV